MKHKVNVYKHMQMLYMKFWHDALSNAELIFSWLI